MAIFGGDRYCQMTAGADNSVTWVLKVQEHLLCSCTLVFRTLRDGVPWLGPVASALPRFWNTKNTGIL